MWKIRVEGGDVENQGGNLVIAVEMTQESNGNDKFKEQREVKIIEDEHIRKNLVLHITFYKIYFQFYSWTYFAQCLSVFILNLDR